MGIPLDIAALIDPEVAAALIPLNLRLGELSDSTLDAIRARLGAVPLPALSDQVARTNHASREERARQAALHLLDAWRWARARQ